MKILCQLCIVCGLVLLHAVANAAPTDISQMPLDAKSQATPNLIFGDGMQVPGYLPAEELEKYLNDAKKK